MRVAVCAATYQRPEGLAKLLDALAAQEIPPSVDLCGLIVDNSPDGQAREQVAAAAEHLPWPLHYHWEQRRGITFARNAALEKVTALGCDFIASVDDDEVPAAGWLMALVAAQRRSGATAVQGAVLPVLPDGTPEWLVAGRFFELECHPDGAEVDDAHTGNMLMNVPRLNALGLRFDHRYALTGGEDTIFFRDLLDAGDRIVYAANAVVYETVPASRTRLGWLLRRWYRTGNIEAALFLRGPRRGIWRRPANVARGIARVGVGAALFLGYLAVLGFGRKDRIVRPLYTLSRGCGILTSTLGWNYSEYRRVHGA